MSGAPPKRRRKIPKPSVDDDQNISNNNQDNNSPVRNEASSSNVSDLSSHSSTDNISNDPPKKVIINTNSTEKLSTVSSTEFNRNIPNSSSIGGGMNNIPVIDFMQESDNVSTPTTMKKSFDSDSSLNFLSENSDGNTSFVSSLDRINVATLPPASFSRMSNSSGAKKLREEFNIEMEMKFEQYEKSKKSGGKGSTQGNNSFLQTTNQFFSNLTSTSKQFTARATALTKIINDIDFSTIVPENNENYDDLLIENKDDYLEYTRSLEESYSIIFNPSAELQLSEIQKNLGFEYLENQQGDPLEYIDYPAAISEFYEQGTKRISTQVRKLDLHSHESNEMVSYLASFIGTGYKEQTIKPLLEEVASIVKSIQLTSMVDINLLKTVSSFLGMGKDYKLHDSIVQMIDCFLSNCALSSLVSIISASSKLLHRYYFDDSPISDPDISHPVIKLIEQIEITELQNHVSSDIIHNRIQNTPNRYVSRIRSSMRDLLLSLHNAHLSTGSISNQQISYLHSILRLIKQILQTDSNGLIITNDSIWDFFIEAASKPQPHPKYDMFLNIINSNRSSLSSSTSKLISIVIDIFNSGLSPYMLPFLLPVAKPNGPCILQSFRSVLLISHYLMPLREPFIKLNIDEYRTLMDE